jgi:cobalt-zinc-cadmium efflux system outer membrane protein
MRPLSHSLLTSVAPSLFLLLSALAHAAAPIPLAAPAPTAPAALATEVATSHPELAFYTAELAAARATARGAGTRADPELSVSAGHKRVRSAGTLAGEGTAWSVSLAQTFEWPGRLALRKAVANRDVALAELGLARFEAALRHRTRVLAAALFSAQEKAAAAAEVAERFRVLKETFLARDPAGLTPLLETRVIEAQELVLQRRATEAALAASAARVELNQLRGQAPDAPLLIAGAPQSFRPAPPLADLLTAARENHFEFRARKLEVEQQGYAVQLARHERRPSFTVSPFLNRESAADRETTVGLGLSVPLPLSSRSNAAVDTAEARRRQAEAAVLMAQRELEREVIATVQTFAAKQSESARWTPAAAEKFREAAALADRHYRLGAVPLSTYVELQTAYLDAVEALLDTQREALESALRLHLLTGLDLTTP